MSEAEVLQLLEARRDFEVWLADQSNRNPVFRQELLSEPQQVYSRALQVELPSELQVRVFQENPHQLYLVLPQLQLEAEHDDVNGAGGQTAMDMPILAGAFAVWLLYLESVATAQRDDTQLE